MPFNDPLTEAHEERLQRLEGSMEEVKATTATTLVKMDHLSEKIVEGFETMNKRLDKGTEQFDAHQVTLTQHRSEIDKLHAFELSRSNRWASIRKAVIPLLAAGAGVIATRGGEVLWTFITTHLFH